VASSNSFTVVNELPIEDYLKGVLKIEVNPNWPMEALRAQAITARTYALAEREDMAARVLTCVLLITAFPIGGKR